MLGLTRRTGERIAIGDDITVSVLSIEKGQVRIGVSAPPEIRVLREEIYKELEAQNRASTRGLKYLHQIGDALKRWRGEEKETNREKRIKTKG